MRWPPPKDWPHADHSRQVFCHPHRWHVQEFGAGPTVLLLHGAGGSTHSFRDLATALSKNHHVVAIDLPGQGYTQLGARHRSGLASTTEDIVALCAQEGWQPVAIIGHSAGGALALRLSERVFSPQEQTPRVIGINPALDNFKGLAGVLFPVLAKLLAAVPFTAQIFASATSSPARIAALIRSTGSELDAQGLSYYQRLISNRNHADATLMMMAQWSLDDLLRDLPTIPAQTLFIVGDKDATVPPSVSDKAAQKLQNARVIHLEHLGHLAHEEAPEEIARLILAFLSDHGA
ncbi:magnesium chelatase [Roseobacter denitrificans]|uniref:Magnesium-chelatase 30 kDa subunit n=1 Tax=Roseobacter denitrificans (strain ATCC 33942 / OCh 114) TaxID=375451 RepID=Q16DT4_ROSDO|nr:alpha/beta fold hydrolase BchO [Roseobacter denitrificans]ABG29859.1 magnesium-chelatase 30 kDa subunit [Roseobacter denitrificans OCh 114]AVL53075.1 magnesium chelatase [Roseobacter denitrificans]SFG25709.1 magnesium chelatase accessory protein [Roseobacter denitrificans OCh 114]